MMETTVEGFLAIFTAAYQDVTDLVAQRQISDEALDQIEADQESQKGLERSSAAAASAWVGAAAGRAKRSAEMAYYDREIVLRKHIFGQQVCEELQLASRSLADCPDNDLTALLRQYQADTAKLARTKQDYADEIARLGGHAPSENQSLVIPADEASDGQFVQHDHSHNSDSMTEEDL